MARQRYALTLLFGLALGQAALRPEAQGQTSLLPEAGILVLRNGGVIDGKVVRAGDRYVVTQGNDVEMRLAARDVEAFCGSLDEAYEFKLRHTTPTDIKAQLDLGEWCLRHGLHARCAERIAAAMRLDANHARLKMLESRLEFAVAAPPPPPAATKSASGASLEQIEATLKALPKGSVDKFTGSIQPILLNRCGANQCHGPNAKSEFRLLRPPAGQIAGRRFTQRNLYSTLRYLDRSHPESSPLVTMPQRRHGGSPTAVFDKHTQNQLAELIAWSKITVAAAPPPAPVPAPVPATIAPADVTLSQQATRQNPSVAQAASPGVQVMRPALHEGRDSESAEAQRRFTPRDPYDPELFNRRYHGSR
jgi:hypothetical protein